MFMVIINCQNETMSVNPTCENDIKQGGATSL